jgi:hypothetical protein
MGARQVVLLTPLKSSHLDQLLFYKYIAAVSPLEFALVEVLILKSFKFPRMNTYKKIGGGVSHPEIRHSPLVTPPGLQSSRTG